MKNFNLKKYSLKNISFLVLFVVPLNQSRWHELKFNKIKTNQVQYFENKIQISVNQSASPLLYNFLQPQKLSEFEVSFRLHGLPPKIPVDQVQGQKNYDDFILRFGLVVSGNKRMTWIERLSAPDWLIEMEKLLPKGKGVKEIVFFTTCQNTNLLNKKRVHSLNSLLIETCLLEVKKEGSFLLKKSFDKPIEILGLWIGADGDDTGAKFQLDIEKINLNYK